MTTYTITVAAHVDESRSEWFDQLTITHHPDGTSTLTGTIPDQMRLFTVLNKIRDMNLTLIGVQQVDLSAVQE